MKFSVLGYLCFFFFVSIHTLRAASQERASTPPRGWNSYDSFSWTISEEEFLQSAEIIAKRLKPHGYEYVVVDYLWYRRNVAGSLLNGVGLNLILTVAYTPQHNGLSERKNCTVMEMAMSMLAEGFDVIEEWGRPEPDPGRWPSSRTWKGFTVVANKVHGIGLKFGIHVMRGLNLQAFNANTPILDIPTGRTYGESGRQWRAQDIGLKERACAWMPRGFMSVNTKLGAGRAFLRSLYHKYAHRNVDFVNMIVYLATT